MQKVLIGTPTYEGKEYCLHYWMQRLKEIVKTTKANADVVIIDNSKSARYPKLLASYGFKVLHVDWNKNPLQALANARKKLWKLCLKGKYDFLFSLEQDIVPPADVINELFKLRKKIKSKKVIIGIPYWLQSHLEQQGSRKIEVGYITSASSGREWYAPYNAYIQKMISSRELPRKELMKVHAIGLGCTLIDSKVLKEVPVYYRKGSKRPDDGYFYVNCETKKVSVYSANMLYPKIRHFKGCTFQQESWRKNPDKGKWV